MVPVIAGDKARWPRTSLSPIFCKDWRTRCLLAACLRPRSGCPYAGASTWKWAQWCQCFTLDKAPADARQMRHRRSRQLWASGHIMQDSWQKRDVSLLRGNETASSSPLCPLRLVEHAEKLQVQQLFTVSLLSLQHQGMYCYHFLQAPATRTLYSMFWLINLWLHSSG